MARSRCRRCGEPFTDANVYSEAGWLEARISGLCETCFDALAAYGITEPFEGLVVGCSDHAAGIRESGERADEDDPRAGRETKGE
ncbi:hypothetical protein HDG34_002502 [Paraburkholderia sp. HC6.4b]|uniref:hypothetical protein n=1 Tax=unclassified Paraburkholderia TaxID=2615204 RepID=UPI0016161FBF|nr:MULTISPECIES: hypothetical protein [unclassified Paraburkholderia]MBB5408565.1 hypothetical protein [Paraburkholderia sp. HC6.4b]MBB5450397.1 hypothetical protein [Paraburkholderia sp. Kb1A]